MFTSSKTIGELWYLDIYNFFIDRFEVPINTTIEKQSILYAYPHTCTTILKYTNIILI